MTIDKLGGTARAVSIDVLQTQILPQFLNPVPTRATLRRILRDAKIPCFKTNPIAKRGGGPVFYSASAVEKLFRAKLGGAL